LEIHVSTTHILGLLAVAAMTVGIYFSPTHWRLLKLTPAQMADALRQNSARFWTWQQALIWLGIGLLLLATWRSFAGV
jgi:hypothetical protein